MFRIGLWSLDVLRVVRSYQLGLLLRKAKVGDRYEDVKHNVGEILNIRMTSSLVVMALKRRHCHFLQLLAGGDCSIT